MFSDSTEAVTHVLDEQGVVYDVERKRVRKQGEERVFTHIHIKDRFPFELTLYPSAKAHYVFKSSITGKAIERASIAQLEQLLEAEYPRLEIESAVAEVADRVDRFQVYEALLLPLEYVKEDPRYHPEGDVLYHSLQVFDLRAMSCPTTRSSCWPRCCTMSAKRIDREDHVAAGLEALRGFITPRTAWLIEHHMLGQGLLDGTIGVRARRRLQQSEHFEELPLLCRMRSRWPAGRCGRTRSGRGAGLPPRAVPDFRLKTCRRLMPRMGRRAVHAARVSTQSAAASWPLGASWFVERKQLLLHTSACSQSVLCCCNACGSRLCSPAPDSADCVAGA